MTALPPADAATIAAESAVTDGAAVAPTPTRRENSSGSGADGSCSAGS